MKKQEVTTPLTTGALQKSDIEEKQQLRFSKLRPRAHFPTLDSKRGFPIGHDRPVRTWFYRGPVKGHVLANFRLIRGVRRRRPAAESAATFSESSGWTSACHISCFWPGFLMQVTQWCSLSPLLVIPNMAAPARSSRERKVWNRSNGKAHSNNTNNYGNNAGFRRVLCLRTCMALHKSGPDPTSQVGGGDFSNIWKSSFMTASLL